MSDVDKHAVKVEITGIEYSLKSDKDAEYVQALARYVEEKIEKFSENTSVKSQTKIAVLVALNIADEFFRLKKQHKSLQSRLESVESKSSELNELIDSQLKRFQ